MAPRSKNAAQRKEAIRAAATGKLRTNDVIKAAGAAGHSFALPLIEEALDDLARLAYDHSKSKGFHSGKDGKSLPTKIALIHSEVTEALEALRTPTMQKSDHCPELTAFEEELADIVIRVADIAKASGSRLGYAVAVKHRFNLNRPHKHGGKRF